VHKSLIPETTRKVLVIFGGAALYGMERGVIEIFDLLRPEVQPHFLISQTPRRLGLPLFNEIEKRKFDYSFLSDRKGWERLGKPKSFSHLYKMLIGLLRGNLDALREVRRHDMLYVANLFAAYSVLLAMFYCRLKGRRVIYHFHDLLSFPSWQLWFLSFLLTDFVHNSTLGKETVISANRYLEKKQNCVIPNPTRSMSEQHSGQSRMRPFARNRNLVFVGQVSKRKGIDILLDAFELLSESHADLILHLIGECEEPQLKNRMESMGACQRSTIKWWGYQVEVAEFLRAADVYVHPSPPSRLSESFGISVAEAMALGIPIVCFPSGALQEIMIHEETGLVCDQEDPESLAQSINKLLGNADLRKRYGRNANKRYREKYSSAQIKSSWLRVLDASPDSE
jgi:glycosyltransferase involved in cell wall biosynthesis